MNMNSIKQAIWTSLMLYVHGQWSLLLVERPVHSQSTWYKYRQLRVIATQQRLSFFSYIYTCTITKTRVEVLQLLHLYANRLCMHDLQKSSFVKSVRPQPREHIVALWHS